MSDTPKKDNAVLDTLVIGGGGFGGIYMLYKLRELGFTSVGLEAASDVGGAWYWNRYPGARCDVESLVYCYSFSPVIDAEWKWSERYAAQPEIRRYIQFVSERLDLRKDICFNSRVVAASFDEARNYWTVTTENGDEYRARHLISAAGPISAPIMPNIPGLETFKGETYHTARWPESEPDFAGKRVGVIGNGSSGTQLIPIVAKQCAEMTVFIRTPNYYAPAQNRPLTEEDYQRWDAIRDDIRERMRSGDLIGAGDVFIDEKLNETRLQSGADYTQKQVNALMEQRWQHGGAVVGRVFRDAMVNTKVNDMIADFLRSKVRSTIDDANTAEVLTPTDFAYGTKRITVGTGFHETFNLPHVHAVDVQETPIERFTETGAIVDGHEIELDAVIAASGFDALTGALTSMDISGASGQTIKQAWSQGSPTYLGIGTVGFPNLHMIGGPGSPSVLVNVIMANEQQVDWIGGLLSYMRERGIERVDVDPEAQESWTQTTNDVIKGTVLEGSKSWYVGANVEGKPRAILAYAGGFPKYTQTCEDVACDDYRGFQFHTK